MCWAEAQYGGTEAQYGGSPILTGETAGAELTSPIAGPAPFSQEWDKHLPQNK